jgi:hypothetical protein
MWARVLCASKAAKRPAFPQALVRGALSSDRPTATTMNHSDIRGSKPHDHDSSGAASV